MRALMASVELGVRRVGEIVARFGADVVADALRAAAGAHARTVRERLRETFPPARTASPTRSTPTATATARSASASR